MYAIFQISLLLALTPMHVGVFVCVCVTSGSGLFHGIVRKAFTDPCMGVCGVARFIWVEIEGCPCVPSLSHHGKSPTVTSSRPRPRPVPSFCFMLKLSPVKPTGGCSGAQGSSRELSLFLPTLLYPGWRLHLESCGGRPLPLLDLHGYCGEITRNERGEPLQASAGPAF